MVWFIATVVVLAVVVPVLVRALLRVLEAAKAVRGAIGELSGVARNIVWGLEPVPELLKTQESVKQTAGGLARYGGALEEVL